MTDIPFDSIKEIKKSLNLYYLEHYYSFGIGSLASSLWVVMYNDSVHFVDTSRGYKIETSYANGKITFWKDDGSNLEITTLWLPNCETGTIATVEFCDSRIDAANPAFSNAVLAVGLNIDTNSVAVLNEIASTFGGFPVGGTATTVGGILAAIAAAIAWLNRNKADKPDGHVVTLVNVAVDNLVGGDSLRLIDSKGGVVAFYGVDASKVVRFEVRDKVVSRADVTSKVEYKSGVVGCFAGVACIMAYQGGVVSVYMNRDRAWHELESSESMELTSDAVVMFKARIDETA